MPYNNMSVGSLLLVKDTVHKICSAVILRKEHGKYQIHYEGWDAKWDEWIDCNSERIVSEKIRSLEDIAEIYTRSFYSNNINGLVETWLKNKITLQIEMLANGWGENTKEQVQKIYNNLNQRVLHGIYQKGGYAALFGETANDNLKNILLDRISSIALGPYAIKPDINYKGINPPSSQSSIHFEKSSQNNDLLKLLFQAALSISELLCQSTDKDTKQKAVKLFPQISYNFLQLLTHFIQTEGTITPRLHQLITDSVTFSNQHTNKHISYEPSELISGKLALNTVCDVIKQHWGFFETTMKKPSQIVNFLEKANHLACGYKHEFQVLDSEQSREITKEKFQTLLLSEKNISLLTTELNKLKTSFFFKDIIKTLWLTSENGSLLDWIVAAGHKQTSAFNVLPVLFNTLQQVLTDAELMTYFNDAFWQTFNKQQPDVIKQFLSKLPKTISNALITTHNVLPRIEAAGFKNFSVEYITDLSLSDFTTLLDQISEKEFFATRGWIKRIATLSIDEICQLELANNYKITKFLLNSTDTDSLLQESIRLQLQRLVLPLFHSYIMQKESPTLVLNFIDMLKILQHPNGSELLQKKAAFNEECKFFHIILTDFYHYGNFLQEYQRWITARQNILSKQNQNTFENEAIVKIQFSLNSSHPTVNFNLDQDLKAVIRDWQAIFHSEVKPEKRIAILKEIKANRRAWNALLAIKDENQRNCLELAIFAEHNANSYESESESIQTDEAVLQFVALLTNQEASTLAKNIKLFSNNTLLALLDKCDDATKILLFSSKENQPSFFSKIIKENKSSLLLYQNILTKLDDKTFITVFGNTSNPEEWIKQYLGDIKHLEQYQPFFRAILNRFKNMQPASFVNFTSELPLTLAAVAKQFDPWKDFHSEVITAFQKIEPYLLFNITSFVLANENKALRKSLSMLISDLKNYPHQNSYTSSIQNDFPIHYAQIKQLLLLGMSTPKTNLLNSLKEWLAKQQKSSTYSNYAYIEMKKLTIELTSDVNLIEIYKHLVKSNNKYPSIVADFKQILILLLAEQHNDNLGTSVYKQLQAYISKTDNLFKNTSFFGGATIESTYNSLRTKLSQKPYGTYQLVTALQEFEQHLKLQNKIIHTTPSEKQLLNELLNLFDQHPLEPAVKFSVLQEEKPLLSSASIRKHLQIVTPQPTPAATVTESKATSIYPSLPLNKAIHTPVQQYASPISKLSIATAPPISPSIFIDETALLPGSNSPETTLFSPAEGSSLKLDFPTVPSRKPSADETKSRSQSKAVEKRVISSL